MILALVLLSGLLGYEVGIVQHEDDYVNGYYHGDKDGNEIGTFEANGKWCQEALDGKFSEMMCLHCVQCLKLNQLPK